MNAMQAVPALSREISKSFENAVNFQKMDTPAPGTAGEDEQLWNTIQSQAEEFYETAQAETPEIPADLKKDGINPDKLDPIALENYAETTKMRKSRKQKSDTALKTDAPDTRIKISLSQKLHENADKMLDALKDAMGKGVPVYIYRRDCALVRLTDTIQGGIARCEILTPESMRYLVSKYAVCYLKENKKTYEVKPPLEDIRSAMAHPNLGLFFKNLDGVVHHPTINSDGKIITGPGYDSNSRLYVDTPNDLALAVLNGFREQPMEVTEAATLLMDLFGDFPFKTPDDKAHTLAMILTLLIRPLIPGRVPAFFFHAPTQGTGKTLLAEAIITLVCGSSKALTLPDTESEVKKVITSELIQGKEYIFFDNIFGKLKSPTLSAVITTGGYSDRRLGGNQMVSFNVTAPFIFTGNNAELSKDMVRRTISIGLDAKMEAPEKRPLSSFKNPDILGYIQEHRGVLIQAALTLVLKWQKNGRPMGKKTLGGFEGFTRVIGGILENAGIEGFLDNREAFTASADTESASWRAFVTAWHDKHPEDPQKAADLAVLAVESEIITEKQRERFPYILRNQKDRVYAGFKICYGIIGRERTGKWYLDPAK